MDDVRMTTTRAVSTLLIVAAGSLAAALNFLGCQPKPPEHGVEYLLLLAGSASDATAQPVAETTKILRDRLTAAGFKPYLQATGTNLIRIKLPPANPDQAGSIKNLIARNASLEFRLVHEENDRMIREGITPAGYEIRKGTRSKGQSEVRATFLTRKEPVPGFSGKFISQASVVKDNLGNPQIGIRFAPAAAKTFGELTSTNLGRQIAIVLNGEVLSAPVVRSPILQGSAVLAGSFTEKEALELASMLMAPLPCPVRIVSEQAY